MKIWQKDLEFDQHFAHYNYNMDQTFKQSLGQNAGMAPEGIHKRTFT